MKRRLQDWLTAQAQRRPEACAVMFNGQSTTYGELDESSSRLARALQDAGCVRGDRVALLLPKSPQALIGIFAALKADCLYVPLDTSSPAARLSRILGICESRCLLAAQSTAGLLNELTAAPGLGAATRIGWLDGGQDLASGARTDFSWCDVKSLSAAAIDSQNDDADPAHILFTSGSTGAPKGVVITHSNVIHFVRWATKYFGLTSSDRTSGHSPLHFDLSTFDIFGTLAAGAQLHLVPPELNVLPTALAQFIRAAELTQWFSVPSLLSYLAKFDVVKFNDFPTLRRLLW